MTPKTIGYIERAKAIHHGKYDYSLVMDIKTNKQYIDIICPEHGKFSQAVASHVCAKQGCPRCGGNYRKTTEEVKEEIRKVHGDKFDYLPFEYKHNKQKITIICRQHGPFDTGVKEHLYGGGCPRCAKNSKLDTPRFIEKARAKHGDKYSYDQVDYHSNECLITIICSKHGPFQQTPHAHLAGYGCSRCVANSSKKENAWLDSLNISGLLRQHRLMLGGKRRIVDGFDPATNTVYEFHGDYFHGNSKYYDHHWTQHLTGKTFGELYRATKEKEKLIKDAGYQLVVMWESDYSGNNRTNFRRKPVDPAERLENRVAFIRYWTQAEEEDRDHFDFESFIAQGHRTV